MRKRRKRRRNGGGRGEHKVLRVSRKCFIHAAYAEVPSSSPPLPSPPASPRFTKRAHRQRVVSNFNYKPGEVSSSFPKCGGHVKLRVYPETPLAGGL